MKRGLLALLAVSCAADPGLPARPTGAEVLTITAGVRGAPYRLGRADLAALPRGSVRAVDPADGRESTFDGVALVQLVRRMREAPPEPRKGRRRAALPDTLVFTARDGRQLALSVTELNTYRPLLADRRDGAESALALAWPPAPRAGLALDPGREGRWLRDVTTLALEDGAVRSRRLRPPPGVSAAARLGAGQYEQRCASCHRLREVGGSAGPALDGAVGRLGTGPLAALLERHPGMREQVGLELTPAPEVAGQVAAYLAAIEEAGPPPADDAEEDGPPGSGPGRP
jgi:hypothetical protein